MSNFKSFRNSVQDNVSAMLKEHQTLFLTDISKDALWDAYLNAFPAGTNEIFKTRREYDCNCCKQFIRPFGNVVAVKNNELVSFWDIPGLEYPFDIVAAKLSALVKSASIVNAFASQFSKIGVSKNVQLNEDGSTTTWEHFYCDIPKPMVVNHSVSVESVQGTYRDNKNVFKRSMDELSVDAAKTILELIDQDSLYRGAEHKRAVAEFLGYKTKYEDITRREKDNWCWINSVGNNVARIRNTAIGTMLVDLSEGTDLDVSVAKFEKVMAPTNYKRPAAVFTKKMVDAAQKQIEDMGFSESLGRRFATTEDITVSNVLFVNRDTRKKMGTSVFDDMKEDIVVAPKTLSKIEEVSIEEFVTNILPTTRSIELMMEGNHQGNLMSLVAPQNKEAPSMLKWGNNFGWAYNGDISDSMKQHVKAAGGDVTGVLRFSIQWNDNADNHNDFDAHCIEPGGNRIYFGSRTNTVTTGKLDVDIQCPNREVAVENITWTDINKMKEGTYVFSVHNYAHRGGTSGFTAEIEYNGQIYSYSYPKELKNHENVVVAEIKFSRKDGITFVKSLSSSMSSKEVWGVKTNQFVPVSMFMFSPNFWDGQVGIGNKHYFFILNGCKNDGLPRGFFNEFLKESLTTHRKVFEALGSRMRVEPSDNQLSGLGFSSTQRNSIIAKIDGNFNRTIKINF